MQIVKTDRFTEEFEAILHHISEDSLDRALQFAAELDKKILSLPFFPMRCRKSIYFDASCYRDLIFKGYTIPYKIDEEKEQIWLLAIIKWKLF